MQSRTIYRVSFWLLLLSFEVFLFTLPLFPTGDGPLHLYYSSVFRAVATHHWPLYGEVYNVRHLVQPYLFHYYALIALEAVVSPDMAEKILIGIILAGLAIGFRSLVTALSPDSPALPLFVFALVWNWPLSIGALNYSLGVVLLLFALTLYYRFSSTTIDSGQMVGFFCVLMLLLLAHPVPILLLVTVISADIFMTVLQDRRREDMWRFPLPQAIALGVTCITFVLSILIADKSQVHNSVGDIRLHSYYLHYILTGSRLRMFYIDGRVGDVYDLLVVLTLPVSFLMVILSGLVSRLRQGRLTASDRLALFTFLFLVATLFAPENANGSSLFAVRLWLPCWLIGVAAASGSLRGRLANRVAAVFLITMAIWTLGLGITYLRPVALSQASLEGAPIPSNARGLFIQSDAGDAPNLTHTSYSVNFWEGGRAFAAHHDVLLNSPWLQLSIMPVTERDTAGLMRDYTDQNATENPNQLSEYLRKHPDQRARALASADFILFTDPTPGNPNPLGLAQSTLGPGASAWHCTHQGFYAVCEKNPTSTIP